MRLHLSTVLALALVGGLAEAQPSADRGLRTGGGHLVVVTSSPSEGLEVGIARDSWYARGVAFDLAGRWEESYNAFREAQTEFQNQLRDRPAWAKMIRGWLLKAEFQLDQSQRLKYPLYYRFGPPSASVLYYRAAAKHNKWLAVRAFTGRADRKLQGEVIDEYAKALAQSPTYESARIALAAILHETGQHARARQEFARVQYTGRSWLSVEVAYYFTAAGEYDRALEMLDRAIQYNPSNKRYILRSNDFDRIRSNPRFKALIGEP